MFKLECLALLEFVLAELLYKTYTFDDTYHSSWVPCLLSSIALNLYLHLYLFFYTFFILF